jgi:hypothetical protein
VCASQFTKDSKKLIWLPYKFYIRGYGAAKQNNIVVKIYIIARKDFTLLQKKFT